MPVPQNRIKHTFISNRVIFDLYDDLVNLDPDRPMAEVAQFILRRCEEILVSGEDGFGGKSYKFRYPNSVYRFILAECKKVKCMLEAVDNDSEQFKSVHESWMRIANGFQCQIIIEE